MTEAIQKNWVLGAAVLVALAGMPDKAPAAHAASGKQKQKSAGSQPSEQSASDPQVIKAQAQEFAAAFARGDAAAIAGMWAPEGRFIDENGREFIGRAAIEGSYRNLFKRLGGQPIVIEVESVSFPAPGVAIEEGTARLARADGGPATRYTAVHTWRDGRWQMQNVSETAILAADSAQGLSDVSWLVGSWRGAGNRGTLNYKVDWAPSKKFILITLEATGIDGTRHVSQEIIGWNPTLRQIMSWNFDSAGGYGVGNWNGGGNSWTISARSQEADGSRSRALYILQRKADGKFTVQSRQRSVNGVSLPDTDVVTVVRTGS